MDNKTKKLNRGDHVIYFDQYRVPHDALVETWWLGGIKAEDGSFRACESIAEYKANYGEHFMPSVNLVYIDSDPNKIDQYGGQKVHEGSVIHGDQQAPARLGNYWLFPDEVSKS